MWLALVLMTDLRLAPQPEPFKWEVSVIEPPPQVKRPEPRQQAPAPPTPQAEPEPVQPQPVVQEPQPVVQTVQEIVQREVRTVTPVVQAAPQPVRSEPQVIARTAQPIETPPAATVERPPQPVASIEPTPQPIEQTAPAVTSPAATEVPTQPASQPVAAVQTIPVRAAPAPQRDYGWLAETLRERIEELKRYPPMARMNNWQGKVVLKFVVTEDGTVENLEVVQSSGHAVLDEAAMDTIRRASPLPLKHELGKPRVTFQFPISYTLR